MVAAARELPTTGYSLEVDGRLKAKFDSKEGARSGAEELKKRFPMLRVKVYDAVTRPRGNPSSTNLDIVLCEYKTRGFFNRLRRAAPLSELILYRILSRPFGAALAVFLQLVVSLAGFTSSGRPILNSDCPSNLNLLMYLGAKSAVRQKTC